MSSRRWAGVVVLALGLASAGCTISSSRNDSSGAGVVTMSWAAHVPKRIAVLPFESDASIAEVDTIARFEFAKHLSVLPYEDVEVRVVDKEAKGKNLSSLEERQRIGKALGADTIVRGRVLVSDHRWALIAAWNIVKLEVAMENVETGQEIWKSRDTAFGISFGLDPISWVFNGYREMIWWREFYRRLDDACRNMTKTIPQAL